MICLQPTHCLGRKKEAMDVEFTAKHDTPNRLYPDSQKMERVSLIASHMDPLVLSAQITE